MEAAKFLSIFYNKAVREILTKILMNPRFSVNRADLDEVSELSIFFGETDSYHLTPPIGSNPIPTPFKNQERLLKVPEPFVCELAQTQIVGSDILTITDEGQYVIEETVAKPEMLADAIARTLYQGILPFRRKNTRKINRPVASLTGIQSRAFFHWFADYLPRVQGIEKYAEVTGTYPDVLIPPDGPDWMKKSIRHIGIPEEHLVEWDGRRTTADKFVIPSVPRDATDRSHHTYSPQALRWVGNRIKSNIELGSRRGNRILLTRRGASTRRIINEEAVKRVLSPYGFESVDLTELSFEDQVKLFSGAEAIIAPHGAGLINTIYSENIKIVEIFGDFITPLYYCITGGLGFPYRYEICSETRPAGESTGIPTPGNDIIINTDRIETIARDWLLD